MSDKSWPGSPLHSHGRISTAKIHHACVQQCLSFTTHTLMHKFIKHTIGNKQSKRLLKNHTCSEYEPEWNCLTCYEIKFIFKEKKYRSRDASTVSQTLDWNGQNMVELNDTPAVLGTRVSSTCCCSYRNAGKNKVAKMSSRKCLYLQQSSNTEETRLGDLKEMRYMVQCDQQDTRE